MCSKGFISTILWASLLWGLELNGQSWLSLISWGGLSNESVDALAIHPDGRTLVGGTFSGQGQWANGIFRALGAEDIFIAGFSSGRNPDLLLHLGSPGQDYLAGIGSTQSGGLYCGGVFWQQLPFPGGVSLQSSRNPKAIFAAQFAPGPDLRLEWARMIEGGNVKELCGVAATADGGLIVAGYFSDTLFIDTFRLVSEGRTDAFIVRLDARGYPLWAKRFGKRGDVRIKAIVIAPGETPVITGVFNDQAAFGNTLLSANTRDWDIFVAALGMDGTLRWARKAGGVYDDEVYALAADNGGNLYLTGQFIGVLDLGPGQGIQSQDGNADAFVLKYHPNGTPLWARVLSGDRFQIARAIAVRDSLVAVTGYFQENLRMADRSVVGGTAFNGFIAILHTDGTGRDLVVMPGALPIFPEAILPIEGTSWSVGGVYQGSAQWGGLQLSAPVGGFDVFLGQWGNRATQISEPLWAQDLRIFPNPASEGIRVQHEFVHNVELSLFDLLGRMVIPPRIGDYLPMADLPPGPYLLRVRINGEQIVRKIFR